MRKAYDGAAQSEDLFRQPDAPTLLGVGKNMVRAIRHWGLAFKVLESISNPARPRMPFIAPSFLGESLFGADGWDRFLEDINTLWLLHWKLFSPPCLMPAWWIVFNGFSRSEVDESRLAAFVSTSISSVPEWPEIVESSIQKDVNCLLRTYAPRRKAKDALDDLIDSPFRELHILELQDDASHAYRFSNMAQRGIDCRILGFACLDYASRNFAGPGSITLMELTRQPGCPGLVFKLSEEAVVSGLEQFTGHSQDTRLSDAAGLRQLMFERDPKVLAERTLGQYYGRPSRAVTTSRSASCLPLFTSSELTSV